MSYDRSRLAVSRSSNSRVTSNINTVGGGIVRKIMSGVLAVVAAGALGLGMTSGIALAPDGSLGAGGQQAGAGEADGAYPYGAVGGQQQQQ
jgi:hypothetical protein